MSERLKPGLSGYVPVRNGIKLDYCFELAIQSLLPVCDEVIACDSDSTDGTREFLDEWAQREPKLRVINYPWTFPAGDPWMLKKWLNYIRSYVRFDCQITLDADEILHPDSCEEVCRAVTLKGCRWFKRYNFWKDHRNLVPDGHVCGMNVVRMGPSYLEMVSDNPNPEGEPEIRQLASYHDTLKIWHLGFLRKPEAFFAKSRVMQGAVCNSYDPRLVEAEKTGQPWYEVSSFNAELVPYDGPHPEIVKPWLRERGYSVE